MTVAGVRYTFCWANALSILALNFGMAASQASSAVVRGTGPVLVGAGVVGAGAEQRYAGRRLEGRRPPGGAARRHGK